MQIVKKGNRKAISPVLATVILIAITLIAAIAIAGFVFGLFGTFTTNALVTGSVVTCDATSPANCDVRLVNTGTSNTHAIACSLTFGGTTNPGTVVGTTVVGGAGPITETCTTSPAAAGGSSGSSVVGSFTLANSGVIAFSGSWS